MQLILAAFVPWSMQTILLMTVSGTALTLLLLILRAFFGDRLSWKTEYRLWKVLLLGFLIPLSLFLSVPVSTPVTGVQYAIERNVGDSLHWSSASTQAEQETDAPAGESGPPQYMVALDRFVTELPAISLAVSVLILTHTVGGYLLFVRKLRRSRGSPSETDLLLYRDLAPGKNPPRFYRSPLVPTPMMVGVIRPTIYLPDREYTETQLRNILLHPELSG